MAAEHVELPTDDARHRHARMPAHRRQQPHLHVPPTTPQRMNRVRTRRFAAHRVDGDVRSATRDLVDAGRHVDRLVGLSDPGAPGQDDGVRALARRERQRVDVAVHGDDTRPERLRDHDGAESDSPGADDAHPFTRLHISTSRQSSKGRREPAPEARGGREAHSVGDGDEVRVRASRDDVLRERSPVREPRLILGRTDLRVTGATPLAGAAALDERHRHPLPDPPVHDVRTDLSDHPGELVTGHVRQLDVIMTGPRVPVAAAQPRRAHLDEDGVVRQGGHLDLLDADGPRDLLHYHCAHRHPATVADRENTCSTEATRSRGVFSGRRSYRRHRTPAATRRSRPATAGRCSRRAGRPSACRAVLGRRGRRRRGAALPRLATVRATARR